MGYSHSVDCLMHFRIFHLDLSLSLSLSLSAGSCLHRWPNRIPCCPGFILKLTASVSFTPSCHVTLETPPPFAIMVTSLYFWLLTKVIIFKNYVWRRAFFSFATLELALEIIFLFFSYLLTGCCVIYRN